MKKVKIVIALAVGAFLTLNASGQSVNTDYQANNRPGENVVFTNEEGAHDVAKGTGTPLGTNLIPSSAKKYYGSRLITARTGLISLKHERVRGTGTALGTHYVPTGHSNYASGAPRAASANPTSGLAAGTGTHTGTNLIESAHPEYYKKSVGPRSGTHSRFPGSNKWNQ